MSNLERAIRLAVEAHQGQRDKNDTPYILHPLRMMLRMRDEVGMMAAVLHDVVEDSDWTIEELREEGFSREVVDAVDAVTRRAGESYEGFVRRAATSPLALRVKLADLEDNMDMKRIDIVSDQDLERLVRYHRAWRSLMGPERETGDA